jgi:hypothetical protein
METDKIHGYSSLFTDKYRYEIQEQREVPVWYTGIYRSISSTALSYKLKYTLNDFVG